jgi:hypothetical protein
VAAACATAAAPPSRSGLARKAINEAGITYASRLSAFPCIGCALLFRSPKQKIAFSMTLDGISTRR